MPPAPTLTAKTRTTCFCCGETVAVGGDIYALEGVPGYLHPDCAREHCKAQGLPFIPPVCKHFVTRGYCLFGEDCFFRHPAGSQASLPEKKFKLRKGASKQTKVRNRFRAATFRRFLLKAFGRELLAQGSGVLDIAGGTGELSFEFLNLNCINSTVVDPRPCLNLERQCRWLKAGFYFRNAVFQEWVDTRWSDFKDEGSMRFPAHQRMLLDAHVISCLASQGRSSARLSETAARPSSEHLADASGSQGAHHRQTGVPDSPDALLRRLAISDSAEACDQLAGSAEAGCVAEESEAEAAGQPIVADAVQSAHDRAAALHWTQKGLATGGHESSAAWAEDDDDDCDCGDGDGGVSGAPAPRLTSQQVNDIHQCWQNASVVVGMHPDQATEHLVQFAMRTRKPFAAVPCCVFPNNFPSRRLNGMPVRKYEDFISYLVNLAPEHIEVEELMFEGRNKVVYCTSWGPSIEAAG